MVHKLTLPSPVHCHSLICLIRDAWTTPTPNMTLRFLAYRSTLQRPIDLGILSSPITVIFVSKLVTSVELALVHLPSVLVVGGREMPEDTPYLGLMIPSRQGRRLSTVEM
jgi:hypothetical protein